MSKKFHHILSKNIPKIDRFYIVTTREKVKYHFVYYINQLWEFSK